MRMKAFRGESPHIDGSAWGADDCTVIGRAEIAPGASLWFGAVIRADGDRITVGERSNVQDGCVLHADPGLPLTVGSGVSVGHRAVLHGCTVADDVLVGMGAVVLNGARIGTGSLLAAGTVVLEGTEIPPHSLVAGVPGRVRRQTTEDERTMIRLNAEHYCELAAEYAADAPG